MNLKTITIISGIACIIVGLLEIFLFTTTISKVLTGILVIGIIAIIIKLIVDDEDI